MADEKVSVMGSLSPAIVAAEFPVIQPGNLTDNFRLNLKDVLGFAEVLYLTSSAGAGSTAINVFTLPTGVGSNLGYVVIDPYTVECEIRKVAGISGTQLTVAALSFNHAAEDVVLWITEPIVYSFHFGANSSETAANNLAGIQAAIDQIAALGGGRVVVNDSGILTIADPGIEMDDDVEIEIVKGTTLQSENVVWSGAIINVNNKSRVKIFGHGVLDGNKAVNTVGQVFGVIIRDSDNVLVKEITAQNMPSSTLTGGSAGDGIWIGGTGGDGSTDIRVEGCTIDTNVRQGISIVWGSRIFIVGNQITNTSGNAPGHGIDVEANNPGDNLQDIFITGNYFENNNTGIALTNSGPPSNILVQGNLLKNHRSQTINCRCPKASIIGNVIFYGAESGIYINSPTAVGVTVADNVVVGSGTGSFGILVYNEAKNVSIIGNILEDTNQTGILVLADNVYTMKNVSILGNVTINCSGPGGVAIHVRPFNGGSAENINIKDNIIYDDRGVGVQADNGVRIDTPATDIGTCDIDGNIIDGVATDYQGFDPFRNKLTENANLDFGNIGAQAALELTITVTGAQVGDNVYASPRTTIEAGLVWSAWVSAVDTVTIRLANFTLGAIDPGSRDWRADVFRH